jgi:hypothetical protein
MVLTPNFWRFDFAATLTLGGRNPVTFVHLDTKRIDGSFPQP